MRITTDFRRAFIAAVSLTFAMVLLSHCGRSGGDPYPGKLGIQHAAHLSGEGQAVEARFAKYLEDNTDKAIARYKEQYGNVVNTDNARELSEDYTPHGMEAHDTVAREARTRWSDATLEPSRALAREIYRRALGKGRHVVFSAGGAGSGKSTTMKRLPEVQADLDGAQLIYDTTLSDSTGSMERIRQALDAGCEVEIIYVYRDPVDAFVNGVLPRAEDNGRTVALDEFINTHLSARESLLRISQEYRNDKRVSIRVVDNSLGENKAAVADLELLEKTMKYDRDDLRQKLMRALDEAYEKGKRGEKGGISEHVYRATKGDSK